MHSLLSYLVSTVCLHFNLPTKNLCSLKGLLERQFSVSRPERDTGRDKEKNTVCKYVTLLSYSFKLWMWKGLHISTIAICYNIVWLYVSFLRQLRHELKDVLIVCFCLVCILLALSISSVFLAPLWSCAYFCFVSLNIALIVALAEVKPPLISFVYIVGDTQREKRRASMLERRGGCDSDCSVWQRPGPVGVGRRERCLVLCLWQSGKSCHGESLGLPSGFLRLFCSQPAFEIISVTAHNTLQPQQSKLCCLNAEPSALISIPVIQSSKPNTCFWILHNGT